MKFFNSVGKYLIVASEVSAPKSGGKIHVLDDSEFSRGKVIVDPDGECGECDSFSVDDDILFFRRDAMPIGHGLPVNVVVVPFDSVVAILEDVEVTE